MKAMCKELNASLLRRCAEHGLAPGDSVIRLIAKKPNVTLEGLYRYSTAASFSESDLADRGFAVTKDHLPWDGVTGVDLDNGD